MVSKTQYFSKQGKLDIVKMFDNSYYIILIKDKEWVIAAGPYLTFEESLPDLRILQYENRNYV